MKAASGVIVAGVVVAIVGVIVWARANAVRESAQVAAEYAEAYGWDPGAVSSGAVYFGVGTLAFGALVALVGVALAVIKAR